MSELLRSIPCPDDESFPEAFEDVCVIVVGDNNCWGKAETLNEAKKLASNPRKWVAYVAKTDTTVSEVDGSLTWTRGFAPRKIASCGVKL